MPSFREIAHFYLIGGWRHELFRPYRLSILAGVAMLIGSSLLRRRAGPRPLVVHGGDLYYFIPVLIWGIQSMVHAQDFLRSDFLPHMKLVAPYALLAGGSSLTVGSFLLALSLSSEFVAERRGLRRRLGAPAIPLPILSVFASATLVWALVIIVTQPIWGSA